MRATIGSQRGSALIFAILAIGLIGVALDAGLGRLARRLAYSE